MLSFFFFNDTATTEIYTLSLHDALPICPGLPIVDLGRTRVIVPSAFALLAASRLPMVVKTRDAPWNTPVVPYVKLDAASKDRKSTRLNSSHDQISYAVFCLKKKK